MGRRHARVAADHKSAGLNNTLAGAMHLRRQGSMHGARAKAHLFTSGWVRRVMSSSVLLAGALCVCPITFATGYLADPGQWRTSEFYGSRILEHIGAEYAYARGYTGSGVLVGVLDSGLDTSHPEFHGRISPLGRNFIQGEAADDLEDFNRSKGQIDGHGTNISGVIAAARDGVRLHGVAYNAVILPLKMNDDNTDDAVIDYAIRVGARVINGSYGNDLQPEREYEDPDTGRTVPNPHWRSLSYQGLSLNDVKAKYEIFKRAADADIVIVYSAGNDYQNQPVAAMQPSDYGLLPAIVPANTRNDGVYRFVDPQGDPDKNNPDTWTLIDSADPRVASLDFSALQGALVAVVAVDREGVIAPYSNRCGVSAAWCVAAPGGATKDSAGRIGEAAQLWSTHPIQTYEPGDGTSMAAPVVAGAAAVLREAFPYMTARQIIEVMLTTANKSGVWGDKATYGHGMLNLGRAVDGPIEFGAQGFAPIFSVDTQGYDSTWWGDISGQGGLVKTGAGVLTLKGRNTYAGPTRVGGGKLVVDGSIASSSLFVEPGAALGGAGSVGPTVMAGYMKPGNSVGTITVRGDYTQLPGSVLEIELGSGGASDHVRVTGAAHIQGGTLDIQDLDAADIGREYSFLSAAGGVSGRFEHITLDHRFIDLDTYMHGTSMKLSVQRNATRFADVAVTGNQKAVAGAIEAMGSGQALYDELVMLENDTDAPAVFDQLSGEIHASARSALLDASGLLRQAASTRLYAANQRTGSRSDGQNLHPTPAGHVLWGQALGDWGRLRGDGYAQGLNRRTSGLMFGVDTAPREGARVGLAAGFTDSVFNGAGNSHSRVDGYHLILYAGTRQGRWALRAGVSHSWHEMSTRRAIAYAGLGTQRADHRARSLQFFSEAGYALAAGSVIVEPYAGLAHVRLHSQGFNEQGGVGALQGAAARNTITYTTLGLRASLDLPPRTHQGLSITAALGWRHALGTTAAQATLRFASGNSYSVTGAPLARHALLAELGMEARFGRKGHVRLGYTGQLGDKVYSHGVQARASWAF